MARPKVVNEHPEVRDHILLLSQYGHSCREIAWMVSQVNGIKVSHDLVWRVLRGKSDLSGLNPDKAIPKQCPECRGRLFQIADSSDPDKIVCSVCGLVVEKRIQLIMPVEDQVQHMMPSNSLNFEKLGQGHPDALLINAINRVNPQFKSRNGDYKQFMLKLWELKAHLGIDDRLRKLKDRASRRLAELGFTKTRHFRISDEVGRLLDCFYERHIRALPGCFQMRRYDLVVDSAVAVILESSYPEDKCSQLQPDFHIKSLMKQFLRRKVVQPCRKDPH